jgi:hypothetical protein
MGDGESEMSDLVKHIREVEQLYKDAGIDGSEGARWAGLAADRIEELEAKLEVATRALKAIARPKTGPDANWTMPEIYRWRAIWYLRHEERARTTLAELKGGRK